MHIMNQYAGPKGALATPVVRWFDAAVGPRYSGAVNQRNVLGALKPSPLGLGTAVRMMNTLQTGDFNVCATAADT